MCMKVLLSGIIDSEREFGCVHWFMELIITFVTKVFDVNKIKSISNGQNIWKEFT